MCAADSARQVTNAPRGDYAVSPYVGRATKNSANVAEAQVAALVVRFPSTAPRVPALQVVPAPPPPTQGPVDFDHSRFNR